MSRPATRDVGEQRCRRATRLRPPPHHRARRTRRRLGPDRARDAAGTPDARASSTLSSVENIAGAAGTIGLARLISAERGSGNVVMISGLIMLGGMVTHRSPVTLVDVTPIARLTGEYEAIVVPAQSPYRTLGRSSTRFARARNRSPGAAAPPAARDQILAGLIADAVGVSPRRVNYIAFSGGGESMSAILGGQVTAGISGLGEFASQLAAGTLRVLAISSAERVPGVDAPTLGNKAWTWCSRTGVRWWRRRT